LIDDVVAETVSSGLSSNAMPRSKTRPGGFMAAWLRRAGAQDAQISRWHGTRAGGGLRRFRIIDYATETPYLIARIEKLKDVADDSWN